jgi:multisubunit Na+/H+ antiporter MnhG subunit
MPQEVGVAVILVHTLAVALVVMVAVTCLAAPMDLVTAAMTIAMTGPVARSVVMQTTAHHNAGTAMMMDIKRMKNPRQP